MTPPREHRELAAARRLRHSIRMGTALATFWLALGIASAAVATWLWGDAIAIRLVPAVLAVIAYLGVLAMVSFGGWSRSGGWIAIVIVLSISGAFAYTTWVTGSPYRTYRWFSGVVVLLVWLGICGIGVQESLHGVWRDARDLREARRRLDVDSHDGERGVRLMSALEEARTRWNSVRREMPVERVLYFGDPILEPERVVVWGVHPGPANPKWVEDAAGNTAADIFAGIVEMQLREIGYPRALDVGVAPAEEVDAAADHHEYFGADGRRREPQAPVRPGYYWA